MTKLKVLTVANRKGGAGKSTCAAHIALEAVKANLKTILIDLDPQKTLETWWNLRSEENPYLTDSSAADITEKIKIIEEKGFDLCIIDTPGDVSTNAIAGIRVADLVLIPSKPTSPDLGAIGRTISLVNDAKRPYIFLVTQAISRSNAALQAASVLSEFGAVAPAVVSNRIAYVNAMNVGTSAAVMDKTAFEELSSIWNFVSTKLFLKKGNGYGKEKI
jgi:chromosome partitioning protein